MKIKTICMVVILFCTVVAANQLRKRMLFYAPADSKLLEVKKGEIISQRAWEWNQRQKANACIAADDVPDLAAHKGDHVICFPDAEHNQPREIPEGYCIIYFTSGCPTCAVGWVYARGEHCDHCLNCAN